MAPRDNKLVNDFLARQAGDDLLEALNTLAGLKFPIPDQLSFEAALEPQGTAEPHKKALRVAFGPQDFPILSPQSALEKYYGKLLLPIPPALTLPPLDLPDFQERPSVFDIYDETFGRGSRAAACARRAYSEAIREGFNSLQATIIGHFAGRRVQRGGACPV